MKNLIKADLHIHTCYSGDSDITLDKLIEQCQRIGLGAIAVTDHGTAEGALELSRRSLPITLIVGEEIASSEGEIIGLFLKESIPNKLSPEDTIQRIRDQEGIVCIPHPFDRYRSSAIQESTFDRIVGMVDIIEVFNSRTIPFQNLKLPDEFAQKHQLLRGAGSDSHSTAEIGRAFVTIPEFSNREEFLQSMAESEIIGKRADIAVYYRSLLRRTRKLVKGNNK